MTTIFQRVDDVHDAIKNLYPSKIKEAANLIVAYPPTQVSVERMFSVLKTLVTNHRIKLKEDFVCASLWLKANTDIKTLKLTQTS